MKPPKRIPLRIALAFLAVLLLTVFSRAQEPQPTSVTSSIEMVRSGTQADRVAIVAEAMGFADKDADKFWPIYRRYEQERAAVDDRRVAVIKEYNAKYPSLSDADAKSMAERMFECDAILASLKKKYYKKFNSVLPALTVTKFFQLDHRIDLLMDLKVESAFPPLLQPQPADQER